MRHPILALCLVLPACLDIDDSELDPDVGEQELAVCIPTLGGHEVCDAADNDCDGLTDEQCGPIDLNTLPGYACPGVGGQMVVGVGSRVFLLSSSGLHRVEATGQVVLNVNANLPVYKMDIERGPGGRLHILGGSGSASSWNARVHVASGVTGEHMGVMVNAYPSSPLMGLAVDAYGQYFFSGGGSTSIKTYNGSGFVAYAPTNHSAYGLSASADGGTLWYTMTSLLSQTTPGGPAFDVDSYSPDLAGIMAVDDDDRLYVSVGPDLTNAGQDPPVPTRIYRYDQLGNRVHLAQGEKAMQIAYDPETHELVVANGGVWCSRVTKGVLQRIPL